MLYSIVSCCKCFVFQKYVQRVMGARLKHRGKGHGKPGTGGWDVRCAWGPADGACSSSSWLPGPWGQDEVDGDGCAPEVGNNVAAGASAGEWTSDRSRGRAMAFF
jgi:hypothetical protein